MTDQTEPQENQHYREQPPLPTHQAAQDALVAQNPPPAQHFQAPAESFGPFGPFPTYPDGAPNSNASVLPAPPGAVNVPPVWPGYQSAFPGPATALSGTAYPYPPGMIGAPPPFPYGMYPPPPRVKQPIRFPLTRHALVLLQVSGMLLYCLITALSFMGCALILLKATTTSAGPYVNPDGSANLLSIVATCILVLFLVPAWSVFSGVFFGSWRGLIVSVVSIVGGFLITHLTDARFGNPFATFQNYLPFAALPLAALAVGLVYDRRQYAVWWKSLLTMLLGAAVLLIWFFASIYISDVTSASITILAGNAHMSLQNYEAFMAISLGFVVLVFIIPLGLLFAGFEALIHFIITKISPTRQVAPATLPNHSS